MRRGERNPKPGAGEHHDDLGGAGSFCQILGVTRKGDPGFIDRAFLYRRRDDRPKAAIERPRNGRIQHREYGRSIVRIELACPAKYVQGDIDRLKGAGRRHMVDIESIQLRDRDEYIESALSEAERAGDTETIERLMVEKIQINEARLSLDRRRDQTRLLAGNRR